MGQFTIGGLAKAAGVGVETVRFYQRKGLLAEPPRGPGTVRRYGAGEVARLRFIKGAQELGFSLKEVQELLSLEEGGACGAVQRLAQTKLVTIASRIDCLRRIQGVLTKLERECAATRGRIKCPIIATLEHS